MKLMEIEDWIEFYEDCIIVLKMLCHESITIYHVENRFPNKSKKYARSLFDEMISSGAARLYDLELRNENACEKLDEMYYEKKISELKEKKEKEERDKYIAQALEELTSSKRESDQNMDEKLPDPVSLSFFSIKMYITAEEQQKLRKFIQDSMSKFDCSSGRGWFCLYAAYRYLKGQLGTRGQYTNFFSDIEALLPNALTNINIEEKGDKRYKSYTTLLGREVKKWYIENGSLPPLNTLAYFDKRTKWSTDYYTTRILLIKDLEKKFRKLEEDINRVDVGELPPSTSHCTVRTGLVYGATYI